MLAPRKQKAVKVPPGQHLIQLLDRNKLANEIAHHLGDLRQICDDHIYMWACAETDDDKVKAHQRFRTQVMRALVSVGGFELTVHGLYMTFGGQFLTASFMLVLGAIILRAMAKH